MARTKQAYRGAKSITLTKDLQKLSKSELLKEGKTLGLFEDITARNLTKISKDDMIRQIIDKRSRSSDVKEITIGKTSTKKGAKKGPKKGTKPGPKKGVKKSPAKTVKKSPAKAKSVYADKTVSALLKECKNRGIDACVGKKSMLKSILIPILERWDEEQATKDKPKVTCTDEQVLVLESGKCVKKTKAGAPYGEAALKKKYGDDYVYDAKLGVVGRKSEVDAYRLEMAPPKPIRKPRAKKSPAKKKVGKKAKRCDDAEDFVVCGAKQVCKAATGRCVADTAAARKGTSSLNVDGRVIIGDMDTLQRLQNILGGTIGEAEKPRPRGRARKLKISPKKVSPPKEVPPPRISPKDPEEIERRLDELLSGEGGEEEEREIARLRARLDALKKERKPLPVPPRKTKPLPPPKKKKTPSPKKKTPSPKKTPPRKVPSPTRRPTSQLTELRRQEIVETFQKCLASLS